MSFEEDPIYDSLLGKIDEENISHMLNLEISPPDESLPSPGDAPSPEDPPPTPQESVWTDFLASPVMQPAAGLYDAVVETGGFVADGVDWLGKHNGLAARADKFLDSVPRPPEWPEASGPVGGVLRTISTFIGAAYSPAKALKAYHWSVRGFGSAAVAGATGFPAEWENSATLIRDMAAGNADMERAFAALPTSVQNLLKALPNMDERHPFYQRLLTGGVEGAFGIPFDALMTLAMTFRASREAKQLLQLDRSLASKKAEITGDFSVQPKLETDPDVVEFRKLQDNLQEAKANKNPQHIEQAEKRIQKFADKNPQGAAIASQPNLISDAGKGVLKSWGVPSLKPQSFSAVNKQGIYADSEQFIDPAKLADIDLSKFQLADVSNTAELKTNMEAMIKKIQAEIKGKVPGRPMQRDVATAEFEKAMARLGTEPHSVLSGAVVRGPKTVEDAFVLDVIRSAHGMKTWRLMKETLAGDMSAARMLPKQMAIGAEIEAIARSVKSPMNKEMLKQIDQSVNLKFNKKTGQLDDVLGFGYGKNFNEEATNMMMRHAEMVREFDGRDLAVRLNMIRDPEAYSQMMRQASRPGMFDGFLEYFYNAILSGLDTIGGNYISSHAFALYQIPVRAMAGIVGVVDSAIVGKTATDHKVGEFMAMTFGYTRGMIEQVPLLGRNLLRVAQMKKPISYSGLQKFEAFDRAAITGEAFAPAISAADKIMDNATRGAFSVKTPLEFFTNSLGRFVRTTQNLFVTGDEMNRSVAWSMGAYSQAYRNMVNSGKSPNGMMRELKDSVRHISKKEGEAVDLGDAIAFVDEVEASAGFRDFVDNYPAMRVLFPFVRSQASIFSAFVNNTPFATLSPRFHKALKAGGGERQLALSKLIVGSGLTYSIYEGWANGNLTGSGPSNHEERGHMSRMGWQPSSIKVSGDSWFANMFDFERSMEGTVERVIDGDTIDVKDADGEVHRVRLKGLNTAELGTVSGMEAKEVMQGILADNPQVTIKWSKMAAKQSGKESWGDRLLGKVYLNGVDVGETMVSKEAGQFRPEPPKYVSIRSFEPFATHLETLVNSFELMSKMDEPDRSDSLFRSAYENVASNLLNKQYTKGLMTIVDVLNGGRGTDQLPGRLMGTLVPAITADTAKHLDPTNRDYRTIDPTLTPEHAAMVKMISGVVSRTPWASKHLIPNYDGLGHIGAKLPSWGDSFFNIMPESAQIDNPVFSSFIVNNYFPKKLQPKIMGADLSLDEYAEYQRLLGTVTIGRNNLMQELRETVANFDERYDTVGPEGTQRDELQAVRESYKMEAEDVMLEKYPTLELRIEQAEDSAAESEEQSVPFNQMNVGDKSMENMFKRSYQ